MCVPGPGEYLVVGPRSWPGIARVGSAIVVVGGRRGSWREVVADGILRELVWIA